MGKKKVFDYGIIVYILVAIGLVALIYSEVTMPAEREKYTDAVTTFPNPWVYEGAEGEVIIDSYPAKLHTPKGEDFVVSSTMPDDIKDHTYLSLRSSQQDVHFYIDGELRAVYDTYASRYTGQVSQSSYVFCEVMAKDAGKPVSICLLSNTNFSGQLNEVVYGEKFDIWMKFIEENLAEVLLSCFMLVLGIVTVFVGLALHIRYKKPQLLERFGWVILMSVCVTFTESRLRQLFVMNSSVVGEITYYIVPILVISIVLLVDMIQAERYHTVYMLVCLGYIIDIIVRYTLARLRVVDLFNSFWYLILLILITLILIIFFIVVDARKHYSKEYRDITIGLVVFFVVAFIGNIIVNWLHFGGSVGIYFMIGLLVLLVGIVKKTLADISGIEMERQYAVAAKESREAFFASISHEIRTPINGVLGMNEMILNENPPEKIEEYSLGIKRSGRILLALINDLLDFSKADAGKLSLVISAFDTADIFKDTIELVEDKINAKGLELKTLIDAKLPKQLFGDEVRIKQILTNLLSNAVKYTKEGSVTVSANLITKNGKTTLRFAVSDTGQGIKPENIDKLFDGYTRFEEDKNKAIEGTGLGLGITKMLLDLMEGTITVQSSFGEGSCFTCEVPLDIADETPMGDFRKAVSSSKNEAEKIRSFRAPGMKMLVVDDNATNITVLRGILKKSEMEIDSAISGTDALILCKKKKYDIIMLDHLMPGMDGPETLRRMRAECTLNSATPVIALTANEHTGIREEYIEMGFNEYLSKPIVFSKLHSILLAYLK